MDAKTNAVTGAALKRAIETRDGARADELLRRRRCLADRRPQQSAEQTTRSERQDAIGTFWDDICSRAMTHQVETSVADGNQIAFSQACAYPDGLKVLCMALCELKGGKIARQTVVQAWDE